MGLRKPLATLAMAGGAFGLSMGIGYTVASAATTGSTSNNQSSSSSGTPTTAPTHVCPNMGGVPGPSSSGPSRFKPFQFGRRHDDRMST